MPPQLVEVDRRAQQLASSTHPSLTAVERETLHEGDTNAELAWWRKASSITLRRTPHQPA
jgi:hypothetical protein